MIMYVCENKNVNIPNLSMIEGNFRVKKLSREPVSFWKCLDTGWQENFRNELSGKQWATKSESFANLKKYPLP